MRLRNVALVGCSNGLAETERASINKLVEVLQGLHLNVTVSPHLFVTKDGATADENLRAEILNTYFADPAMDAVFDVSGGDMANEILSKLDYETIRKSRAVFFGYSDLTTVINAIYSKTAKASFLFQIRNLVWDETGEQLHSFQRFLEEDAYDRAISWNVLQGQPLQMADHIVIGGNVRCFLKLSGTPYMPDVKDKILFLEALGGSVPQISTYFAQLDQTGILANVKGILLGTFTKLQKETDAIEVYRILKKYIPADLPVMKTEEIGHASNAKWICIGSSIGRQLTS